MAAGMRQTLDITRADRIAVNHEHDRDVSRHFLGHRRFRGRESDDQVYFETDEFGCERRQPVKVSVRRAVLDDDVLAPNPTQLGEPLVKGRGPLREGGQAL